MATLGGTLDATVPPSWRLPAVCRFVGRRPVAWLDGALFSDAGAWGAARTAPTLLWRTRPDIGLTDDVVCGLGA